MISTLIALTALSAPAEFAKMTDEPARPAPQTRASEIEARFNVGFAANRENTEGWYSGRCYSLSNPNFAVGNLLVTDTRRIPSNEGPIFDRSVTKQIVLGRGNNGYGAPAEFFDNMTYAQQAEVQQWVDANFNNPNLTEAYLFANSYTSENTAGNTRWEARSDREFHYVRTSQMSNGSAYAFCYFFKKVK